MPPLLCYQTKEKALVAIESIPEWLPNGQKTIGEALNRAATAWASGQLLSVTVIGETISGGHLIIGTEPEDMVKTIGFLFSLASFLSHNVPFGGGEEDDEEDGEEDNG